MLRARCSKYSGPLTALLDSDEDGMKTVNIHVIVDGEVVEVIFNNRTAMVGYAAVKAEDSVEYRMFGDVKGTVETWALDAI